ncbi:C4-dicarboxylate ABC transporter [Streptomyces sp. NRRL B-1140]|uniref:SLC13 family permease n=1 Tax=Streptomyces sp. NRRL B-1140 TaxID=1415549 RepID=UPI0006ADC0AF|nr:SLC13 family permease [Streptomyces sp. NRRL B-1140]KOX06106.1 C4-dicarboxylate ABC transporter [Streptomyces sp. NRRL B-1140]
MTTYLISIAALVAVFAIATIRPINMGILGFAAAFIVGGWVSGISIEDIQAFFPGDMFLVVFGITLLFGIARANGTIDLIMEAALKLVRGKPWAIVWLMFMLAAALMALGSVLAVGMLAPIAMPLAKKYGIDPLLMGMMLSHGALGAAFSPVTVYSVGIGELTQDQGIDVSPVLLFIVPFALNLCLAAVLFLVRGRSLLRATGPVGAEDPVAASDGTPGADGMPAPRTPVAGATVTRPRPATLVTDPVIGKAAGTRPTVENSLTFASIGGLLVAALLGIDVGVTSVCLGALLLLASPKTVEPAMKAISWPAVLLVCGIVTYMGVLTENGTLAYVGQKAIEIPWPVLTALVMLVAVGLISAVGSSFGIILISLPLAAPLLAGGELGAVGFVVALAFCATVVDVSPFSTNGVIVLASAQVEDTKRFQRQMLRYCGYIVVVAPLLAWVTIVLPTSA